jgi:hypothetical protein
MRETHEDSPLQPDVHFNSISVGQHRGVLEGRLRTVVIWRLTDSSISIVAKPTIFLNQIRYDTLQGKSVTNPVRRLQCFGAFLVFPGSGKDISQTGASSSQNMQSSASDVFRELDF